MKQKLIFVIGFTLVFCSNCKKDENNRPPTLTTTITTNIASTTVSSGGKIKSDGGASITARGVCWGTIANPTISNSKTTDGKGRGSYTSSIIGLTPNTTYHVRAYATNSEGTGYGNDVSFTTQAEVASITTLSAVAITSTTAASGGNINSDGGSPITSRGVCWNTETNPSIENSKTNDGSGSGAFISNITGLSPGTTYHLRAYATNSIGTSYGNDVTFSTIGTINITTAEITLITATGASSGGNITNDGGLAITSRGVCWNTSTGPTVANSKTINGSGTGVFTSSIIGLNENTSYYLRAYATHSAGTIYGNELSFTTATASPTVADYDGNEYNTVTIGTQVWMQENLKVTHYRNGDAIANVTDNTAWTNQTSGAFCWYDNNETTNKPIYGALYNYYTTVDNRNLCPTGWHVPTDAEWIVLEDFLGGRTVAGGKLKSPLLWASPNTGADNSSSFTALPGGSRGSNSTFFVIGQIGFWWSTSNYNGSDAWDREIRWDDASTQIVNRGKYEGLSVRCIQGEGQVLPAITTTNGSAITSTTATSGGIITSDGGATVTARGVCWSTSPNPSLSNSFSTIGSGVGSFSYTISGLSSNTTYHVRSYATNSVGTEYGEDIMFKTLSQSLPTLTTTSISSVTGTTSISGGIITNDGNSTISAKGVCWSTSVNPTIENSKTVDGSGNDEFTSNIFGLAIGTTYHVRAYATNSVGTAYGVDISFTTLDHPSVSTSSITGITSSFANSGGNVTSDGGATISARGVCWSTSSNPTTALTTKTVETGTTGIFTSSISGLAPSTTYYVMAYATNSVGTVYGSEISFTTLGANQITDIDGNIYNTVTIGTQVWMKENLKVTHYRNGDAIGNITDNTIWSNLTTGAYCWYNNDEASNKPTYGALYNFYAVDNIKNLCPSGWHVPTHSEFTTLTDYLGGLTVAGGKLKESGYIHWLSPNTGADNISGFTALPSGTRSNDGTFFDIRSTGTWWSSTVSSTNPTIYAWRRGLGNNYANVGVIATNKELGFSVRCVKD